MIKHYFLVVCIAMSLFQTTAQTNKTRINEALTKANEENKYVFISYTTTSCELSEKMSFQMNNNICKSLFNNNYIIVDILVTREKVSSYFPKSSIVFTEDEKKKQVSKFPFWYILDSHGNFIDVSMNISDKNIGYPTTEKEVERFIEIIRKTSKLSDTELMLMAASFNEANNVQHLSNK